jgi:predicted HicB family RNase H-like nuclease
MKKYPLYDIPEDLHRRLKMMAAKEGTSMKEYILENPE